MNKIINLPRGSKVISWYDTNKLLNEIKDEMNGKESLSLEEKIILKNRENILNDILKDDKPSPRKYETFMGKLQNSYKEEEEAILKVIRKKRDMIINEILGDETIRKRKKS